MKQGINLETCANQGDHQQQHHLIVQQKKKPKPILNEVEVAKLIEEDYENNIIRDKTTLVSRIIAHDNEICRRKGVIIKPSIDKSIRKSTLYEFLKRNNLVSVRKHLMNKKQIYINELMKKKPPTNQKLESEPSCTNIIKDDNLRISFSVENNYHQSRPLIKKEKHSRQDNLVFSSRTTTTTPSRSPSLNKKIKTLSPPPPCSSHILNSLIYLISIQPPTLFLDHPIHHRDQNLISILQSLPNIEEFISYTIKKDVCGDDDDDDENWHYVQTIANFRGSTPSQKNKSFEILNESLQTFVGERNISSSFSSSSYQRFSPSIILKSIITTFAKRNNNNDCSPFYPEIIKLQPSERHLRRGPKEKVSFCGWEPVVDVLVAKDEEEKAEEDEKTTKPSASSSLKSAPPPNSNILVTEFIQRYRKYDFYQINYSAS
jgi:hypothetical protein